MKKKSYTPRKTKNGIIDKYLNSSIRSSALKFIDFTCEVDHTYFSNTILVLMKNRALSLHKIGKKEGKKTYFHDYRSMQNLKTIFNSVASNIGIDGIYVTGYKGKATSYEKNTLDTIEIDEYDDCPSEFTKYMVRVDVKAFFKSISNKINKEDRLWLKEFQSLLEDSTLLHDLVTFSRHVILKSTDDEIAENNLRILNFTTSTLTKGIFNDDIVNSLESVSLIPDKRCISKILNSLNLNSLIKSVVSSINMICLGSGIYVDSIYPSSALISTTILKDKDSKEDILRGSPNPYYKIIPALDIAAISENVIDSCKNTGRSFTGAISIVNQMRNIPSNYKSADRYDIGVNQIIDPSNYTYTFKPHRNNYKWGLSYFSYDICKNNINNNLSKNFNRFEELLTDIGRFTTIDGDLFNKTKDSKYLTCNAMINFPYIIENIRTTRGIFPVKVDGIIEKYDLFMSLKDSDYTEFSHLNNIDDATMYKINRENTFDILTSAMAYTILGCAPILHSLVTDENLDIESAINNILVHMHLRKILINSKENGSMDVLGCRVHGLMYLERLKKNLNREIGNSDDPINMIHSRLDKLSEVYIGLQFNSLEDGKIRVRDIIKIIKEYFYTISDNEIKDKLKLDIIYLICDFLINTTPSFILIPGGQGIFKLLQKQLMDEILGQDLDSMEFSRKHLNKISSSMIEESSMYTKSKFRHNANYRYIQEQDLYNFTESVNFLEGFLASTLYIGVELGDYNIHGYCVKNM